MKILGTVISGFLGSGKTTFINRLLREPHGKRIAVVVNEFGEIGIDGALLADAGEAAFVELDNGCLCCSLNQNLEETLDAVRKRGDIDAVVVETTGVADPLTVLWTFTRPRLEGAYATNLIIAMADLVHLKDEVEAHPVARLQIEQAHVIVPSKADRVSGGKHDEALAVIRGLNPHAPVFRNDDPGLVPLVLDAVPFAGKGSGAAFGEARSRRGHSGFSSLSVSTVGKRLTGDELEDFLESLPAQVIRAKGAVRSKEGEGAWIFHKVADDIRIDHQASCLGPEGLVMIGCGLDQAALRQQVMEVFEHA